MFSWRRLLILVLTLLAFSANSIFCRLALREGQIDAATFTAVRLVSGAIALWLILIVARREGEPLSGGRTPRRDARVPLGSWLLAVFLFAYAAAFSFAYIDLSAATGGLILFGFVQATMVVLGIVRGERPSGYEWCGLAIAIVGLVYLFLPKAEAPSLIGGSLMALSGIAWGLYSIYGKGTTDPSSATAGNFARAATMGALLFLFFVGGAHASIAGVGLAVLSGAVTSGLGYVLWYESLKWLTPTRAAVSQLTVPIMVALAGAVFLGEGLTVSVLWSGLLIVCGVLLAIFGKSRKAAA